MRPSAHVELFEHGRFVHSSRADEFLARPCIVCGAPLGGHVMLFGDFHRHAACKPRCEPLRRIRGGAGASVWPNESLDFLLALLSAQTRFVRLFISQNALTVPSGDATLTAGTSPPWSTGTDPVIEPDGGSYGGVAIDPSEWSAPVTVGTPGRRITAATKTFPETTDAWGVVNGYFISDAAGSSGQHTALAFYYANFDDGLPVVMNGAGFTLQLTPYIEFEAGA